MAQYRVLQDTAIGHGIAKAGAVVEYDGKSEGKPGPNLELIKKAGPVEAGVDEALPVAG